MDALAPSTFEAQLLQRTAYPPEESVPLTRQQALDIAFADLPGVITWEISCLLIDAQPHPVWKIRLADDPMDWLFEIDAVTGEIVDRERYATQQPGFDHEVKLYTLRRHYMPAALAEYGPVRIAMELAVKARLDALGNNVTILMDEDHYAAVVDGLTVTFHALRNGDSSWRVEIAPDAMSAQVTEITADPAALATSDNPRARVIAQYGPDSRFWPMEVQAEMDPDIFSLPREGEMTRDAAVACALEAIAAQLGPEAVVALGNYTVGVQLYRFENEGEVTRWHVYIQADPASGLSGYKVVFALRDGEMWSAPTIQDVNDSSNG